MLYCIFIKKCFNFNDLISYVYYLLDIIILFYLTIRIIICHVVFYSTYLFYTAGCWLNKYFYYYIVMNYWLNKMSTAPSSPIQSKNRDRKWHRDSQWGIGNNCRKNKRENIHKFCRKSRILCYYVIRKWNTVCALSSEQILKMNTARTLEIQRYLEQLWEKEFNSVFRKMVNKRTRHNSHHGY